MMSHHFGWIQAIEIYFMISPTYFQGYAIARVKFCSKLEDKCLNTLKKISFPLIKNINLLGLASD